jgi:hypothetical protein
VPLRPAIPRGPLCSPELIPAEDIGWGDRASNTPLLHGRHASPRGYPTGGVESSTGKGVAPEGQPAFTGSYKAQKPKRGPQDRTHSGNLASRNPALQCRWIGAEMAATEDGDE